MAPAYDTNAELSTMYVFWGIEVFLADCFQGCRRCSLRSPDYDGEEGTSFYWWIRGTIEVITSYSFIEGHKNIDCGFPSKCFYCVSFRVCP